LNASLVKVLPELVEDIPDVQPVKKLFHRMQYWVAGVIDAKGKFTRYSACNST